MIQLLVAEMDGLMPGRRTGGRAVIASRRSFGRAPTAMVVIITAFLTLFASCPAANADNGSFLGAVKSLGLGSKDGDEGLLLAGKSACTMLAPGPSSKLGHQPNWVAQTVSEKSPNLDRSDAARLVNAAIDNLCPGVNPFGYAAD